MSERIAIHYENSSASSNKLLYDIVIENTYEPLLDELTKLSIDKRKLCIVSDTNVEAIHGNEVLELLKPYAKEVILFSFPAGEENKNLQTVQELYETLILNRFERSDMLLALGGGVVGDLTGFTAATYLRGIDFIQLPTSLLAQVDSSIGGKTGVDFNQFKNMVGAFYQPKLVYMNLSTLSSLPEKEYYSGMGEIIKHGLIKDKDYFLWILKNANEIKSGNLSVVEEMISRSCKIKRDVVEKDPKEQAERALLNFGHTLGHAIEKLMDFSLLHGECVSIGSILASYISYERGFISKEELDSILMLFNEFSLLEYSMDLSPEEIIIASKNDKKMENGMIKFILLKNIGNAYIDKTVTDAEMHDAVLSYSNK